VSVYLVSMFSLIDEWYSRTLQVEVAALISNITIMFFLFLALTTTVRSTRTVCDKLTEPPALPCPSARHLKHLMENATHQSYYSG
jgi:hypothetical protein